ncbi:transmembrane protein 79-like [Anneissia japonica]|uniref:transmembrane protein 79-like n=1 Tax=Anneissia japonica TaxID=1529436 RepID=UPI0014259BBD|nr:transmembrane protein 79-like [Anneissia japonica]
MSSKRHIQSGIVRDIIVGLLVMAAYFYVGWNYFPIQADGLESAWDRLIYTARWQILEVLLLIVMVMAVANTRLLYVDKIGDPTKPIPGSHIITVHCRVLQNTLEQIVIRVPSELILCTYLEPGSMKILPLLVILFVLARLIFWFGYIRDPYQRALGFAMTYMPTVLITIYCVFCLFNSGATFSLS